MTCGDKRTRTQVGPVRRERGTLLRDHGYEAGLPEDARFRHSTVIGLATRGIMMIESCRVIVPTEK